jgi:hypothetical protein
MGNPCSYGWNNMTPADKGKHCAQCDKVVLDFTSMTDEQLLHFLLKHKNVCGHFNKSQLNKTISIQGPQNFKIPQWPAIAAMLVAGLFSVGPQLHAQKQTGSNGNVAVAQPLKVYPRNSNEKYVEKDSVVTIKIKVVDSKHKKILPGANVTLGGIGNYVADEKGHFSLTVQVSKLPEKILISAYASPEYTFYGEIDVKRFFKNPYYQLELIYQDPNTQIDGGDIYVEPQH